MDLFITKLDLGLDYDKEEQEESEFQERLKIYKLKYAKRFKIIKYSFFITIGKCCNCLVISILGLYF